jgi:hypothetical protein
MEKLKTNDLLRYAFSGGITLFTLFILCNCSLSIKMMGNEYLNATFLGVLAFIIGSLIYSLHRAILYPILYRIVLIIFCLTKRYQWDTDMLIPWRPAKLELDLDINRWKRRKENNSIQNDFYDWGSQIHFLFTTFWGMLTALIISKNFPKCTESPACHIIVAIAILILFAGLVTLWRYHIYEDETFKDKRK